MMSRRPRLSNTNTGDRNHGPEHDNQHLKKLRDRSVTIARVREDNFMAMNQSSADAPNGSRTREDERRARAAKEDKSQCDELHRIHYDENCDAQGQSDAEAHQGPILEVFDSVRQGDKHEKTRGRY